MIGQGKLIYPCGFLCGADYREPGAAADGYQLRIGSGGVLLAGYAELLAWHCAHGSSVQQFDEPVVGWTRRDTENAVRAHGVANVAISVRTLLANGALIETRADSSSAQAFAGRVRLRPLLTGWDHIEQAGVALRGDGPGRAHLPGLFSRSSIDQVAYRLWRFAALHRTLAELYTDLVRRGEPSERSEMPSFARAAWPPASALPSATLLATQRLIACGGAYLDLVT